MIFVTVGTNEAPFDRLLQGVSALTTTEEIVVQYGASDIRPKRAQLVDFLAFDEVVQNILQARVVITHAGVGSIMVSLANGKRPIVVPRRKRYAEAVDDHQLQLGRRFDAAGLVTLVENPFALGEVVRSAPPNATLLPTSSSLAADLRSFLEARVRGASPVLA
jgi:UDP-N-acetylglucosamine transferase subunit ALG13